MLQTHGPLGWCWTNVNPDTLLMGGHYSPHCKNYSFFMRGVDLLAPYIGACTLTGYIWHCVHAGSSKGANLKLSTAFWGRGIMTWVLGTCRDPLEGFRPPVVGWVDLFKYWYLNINLRCLYFTIISILCCFQMETPLQYTISDRFNYQLGYFTV